MSASLTSHLGRSQIAQKLADDVFIACFFEIGLHDSFFIGVGLFLGEAHQPSGPFAKQDGCGVRRS